MQTAGSKFHTFYGTLLKKQNNQKIRSGGWRKSEGRKEGRREEGRREKGGEEREGRKACCELG